MAESGMTRKYLRVYLTDGRELDVVSLYPDQLQYEKTVKVKGWPTIGEAGIGTWHGFLAWSALKRTGELTGKYEESLGIIVAVEDMTEAVTEGKARPWGEAVDPTPREALEGSSLG
jgi:hypothetical protein